MPLQQSNEGARLDDDHPGLEEREGDSGECGSKGDQDGPEASLAEEAQIACTVGDLDLLKSVIKSLAHGEYIEVHQPLGPVDDHGHPIPLEYQGAAIPKKMNKLGSAGKPGSGSLLYADPADEAAALLAAEHELLTTLTDYQDEVHDIKSRPKTIESAGGDAKH